MIDTAQDRFTSDVIDASHELPVLVDFWAPWCGPCRVLGPMLEKLEAEYGGRFRLVKVDSDRNPDLSAQFGVRSIPYVVAFMDGKPVNAFVGALPETQLRAFIDQVIPDPAEIQRRKGARLLAAGDSAGAASSLRAAVALDPENDAARLDLANLLLAQQPSGVGAKNIAEAREMLNRISARERGNAGFTAASTRLAALEASANLPPQAELEARIEANRADLQARLDLANRLIAERQFEPALEQLLAMVEQDRNFGGDAGRKTMLAVFELAADQRDLISNFRRRLAAALNR
jgi:putative thioredoxin